MSAKSKHTYPLLLTRDDANLVMGMVTLPATKAGNQQVVKLATKKAEKRRTQAVVADLKRRS